MGFFSNLVGATIKTALTPITVVKDAVDVAVGSEPDNTKKLIESAGENISDSLDDLCDGKL